MTERPIFVPAPDTPELVKEIFFRIKWHPGFASVQKEKNIEELHNAAARQGFRPLLEISSKSSSERGRHLSAFYMKIEISDGREVPLECAFQGSKVFEHGGPFTDLYSAEPRFAKGDARLKSSGALKAFRFRGFTWPLEPKTAFYDWLYITFLARYRDWAPKLYAYRGFTDVEFNPYRSVNCQARSCALFLSLLKCDLLDEATQSPKTFVNLLLHSDYRPRLHQMEQQTPLF